MLVQNEVLQKWRGIKTDVIAIALLLFITLALLLIANPCGNFPSNDDWIYSDSVLSLVNTGSIVSPGTNAFDFLPIYLAGFVCKIVGFSHEALRGVTVGFHLLGICGLYFAIRNLRLNEINSGVITSVFALNPFLFNLSLSFMTDVPALSLSNWCLFFVTLGIRKREFKYFLWSLICLVSAMSVRQTSLMFAPVILLTGLSSLEKKQDKQLLFIVTTVIPLLAYVSLQSWLVSVTEDQIAFSGYSNLLLNEVLRPESLARYFKTFGEASCYLGIFLFPVTLPLCILWLRSKYRLFSAIAIVAASITSTIPLAIRFMNAQLMPYNANLFIPPHVGTYSLLGGSSAWSLKNLQYFTLFSDLCAFIFCYLLFMTALWICLNGSKHNRSLKVFTGTTLVCVTGAVLVQVGMFSLDRYYVIGIAPFLLCLSLLWKEIAPKKLTVLALILSLVLGGYSTLAAYDYFAFLRAQDKAVAFLLNRGVAPSKIDAGPLHAFKHGGKRVRVTSTQEKGWSPKMRGGEPRRNWRWWPVLGEDFIVATNSLGDYHEIKRIHYWSPLVWRTLHVLILESDSYKRESSVRISF